jgi:hypothetical protein
LIAISFLNKDFDPSKNAYSILVMCLNGLLWHFTVKLKGSCLIAFVENTITIDISCLIEFIGEAMLIMVSACCQCVAITITTASAKEP